MIQINNARKQTIVETEVAKSDYKLTILSIFLFQLKAVLDLPFPAGHLAAWRPHFVGVHRDIFDTEAGTTILKS